jgi:cytochrome c oxidase subunit 3
VVPTVAKKKQAREIGFYLFMVSLAMFFAALLLSYVIKKHVLDNQPTVRPDLPWLLLPSTMLLFTGSFMLQRAVGFIRREKIQSFLFNLRIAFGCALGFCILQTIAMTQMLLAHGSGQPIESKSYALIFLMVLVHVLHFAGGVAHLGFVTRWAHQGHYDHESYQQVFFAGWYWRFLDTIWVLMLLVFYLG